MLFNKKILYFYVKKAQNLFFAKLAMIAEVMCRRKQLLVLRLVLIYVEVVRNISFYFDSCHFDIICLIEISERILIKINSGN